MSSRSTGSSSDVVSVASPPAVSSISASPHIWHVPFMELAESERIEALDSFIAQRDLSSVLRPHYGVDQSDRAALSAICRDEFGGAPLDMVIDDASHLLGPTRASFDALFPLVRPGGRYLIEDWQWQQRRGIHFGLWIEKLAADPTLPHHDEVRQRIEQMMSAGEAPPPPADQPLPRLVIELMLVVASDSAAVADVHIDPAWISVTRGDGDLDPDSFHLGDRYLDHLGLLDGLPGWGSG